MTRAQFQTVLWLRWRLTRNQWLRGGTLGQVLSTLALVIVAALGLGALVGAFFAGWLGLAKASPLIMMGVWDGVGALFCFLWLIGMSVELQRSETIDLQRLLHLPVRLGPLFIVNYLASHLALSILTLVPAMTGLALGLAVGRGPEFLLLIPLAWSLIFAVTAWTYCLRGWLAALMVNQRRRRGIVMIITLAIVLLAQAPNLYFQLARPFAPPPQKPGGTPEEQARLQRERESANTETLRKFTAAQYFVPPFWIGAGARGLADGSPLPALLTTLGCLGIGALGLSRAYRSAVRFYRGDTGASPTRDVAKSSTTHERPSRPAKPSRFLEMHLPGVPEPAAALALATLRSMQRAPEVKMALIMPFIMTVVFSGVALSRTAIKIPEVAKPFIATGAVGAAIFFTFTLATNQFGFDRHAFRALVLTPAERRHLLLGKNLALIPVLMALALLMLTLVTFWAKLPLLSVLAAIFQLAATAPLVALGGNLTSILAPYRVEPGSMKATKMPIKAVLISLLTVLLVPLLLAPSFVPPLAEWLWLRADWTPMVPVNLLLSLGLAALAVFAYWKALGPLGRLLQRREQQILKVVTAEVE